MSDVYYKELGKVLKEVRIKRGLSQQDVADRMNLLSRSTIAGYEIGRRKINIDELFRLCDIYHTNAKDVTDKVSKFLYKR